MIQILDEENVCQLKQGFKLCRVSHFDYDQKQ
jgi:hypothetical protein